MVGVTFFGDFDLASLAIWLFWGFFAVLVYYLQTENMREGYPLETEDGKAAPNQGPFPLPKPKTFTLPHGRGEVTVPDDGPRGPQHRRRAVVAIRRLSASCPPAIPMPDGVGPASWAPRRDVPNWTATGTTRSCRWRPLEAFSRFRRARPARACRCRRRTLPSSARSATCGSMRPNNWSATWRSNWPPAARVWCRCRWPGSAPTGSRPALTSDLFAGIPRDAVGQQRDQAGRGQDRRICRRRHALCHGRRTQMGDLLG